MAERTSAETARFIKHVLRVPVPAVLKYVARKLLVRSGEIGSALEKSHSQRALQDRKHFYLRMESRQMTLI